MKVLLFAGAGASIELGVPGMAGLAQEFLDHAQQWDIEPRTVQAIIGEPPDVERLLEALDRICGAQAPLQAVGQGTSEVSKLDKIRAEVEWFVQHAAERVVGRDARLMWGSILRAPSSIDLTIATTNYDRAIELAANADHVEIEDGFGPFGKGETASWVGFNREGKGPRLIKLHGSTDWYAAGEAAAPTKLRHPMPLFGRALLRLSDGQELGSALVLPSREKLLTHNPYSRLSQTFLNATDDCEVAVFVGSSLRDSHIRDAAISIASRAPLFVVNPSGDVQGIPHAVAVRQRASTFLIGTFPNALLEPDLIKALLAASKRPPNANGTIDAVRLALDTDESTARRCQALERLDAMENTLSPPLLQQLLDDSDVRVARYSLGLVSTSAACESLMAHAQALAHCADPAFLEDLTLLRELRTREKPGGTGGEA
jgi:SIR2-like protein